jgi:hypothetical protein
MSESEPGMGGCLESTVAIRLFSRFKASWFVRSSVGSIGVIESLSDSGSESGSNVFVGLND